MLHPFRPYVVMVIAAVLQVGALDQVRFLGIGHLDLVLWATVAAGLTQPPVVAARLGFTIGLAVDLMGPSHLGLNALGYLLVAWAVSSLAPRMLTAGTKAGWVERFAVIAVATMWLWVLGATTGLVLPPLDGWSVLGVVASAAVGSIASGPHRGIGRLLGHHRPIVRFEVPELDPRLTVEVEPG